MVKKTEYHTKIVEIDKKITDHDHINRYITTQKLNKLTGENFDARLKQENRTAKADIVNFARKEIRSENI